jgi:hypothetical protein
LPDVSIAGTIFTGGPDYTHQGVGRFSASHALGEVLAGAGDGAPRARSSCRYVHSRPSSAPERRSINLLPSMLEYPRVGLIQVDDFDQALVDLREAMR